MLTDPVLTGRIGPLDRIGGPIPDGSALQADMAVVSHLHMDHLHVPSLRRLSPEVRVVVPCGAARWLRGRAPQLSRRVEEVEPGDVVGVGEIRVRVVPAAHDGRRFPLTRHRGPALGFIFEATSSERAERVWFAGDTGLFAAMAGFRPVDIAVVPVGGWGPTLGPTHLDPVQAAEAVLRVGARHAVPIHYGTFWPTGLRHLRPESFRLRFIEPGTRFATALAAEHPSATAHVISPGQTARIPVPGP